MVVSERGTMGTRRGVSEQRERGFGQEDNSVKVE